MLPASRCGGSRLQLSGSARGRRAADRRSVGRALASPPPPTTARRIRTTGSTRSVARAWWLGLGGGGGDQCSEPPGRAGAEGAARVVVETRLRPTSHRARVGPYERTLSLRELCTVPCAPECGAWRPHCERTGCYVCPVSMYRRRCVSASACCGCDVHGRGSAARGAGARSGVGGLGHGQSTRPLASVSGPRACVGLGALSLVNTVLSRLYHCSGVCECVSSGRTVSPGER